MMSRRHLLKTDVVSTPPSSFGEFAKSRSHHVIRTAVVRSEDRAVADAVAAPRAPRPRALMLGATVLCMWLYSAQGVGQQPQTAGRAGSDAPCAPSTVAPWCGRCRTTVVKNLHRSLTKKNKKLTSSWTGGMWELSTQTGPSTSWPRSGRHPAFGVG